MPKLHSRWSGPARTPGWSSLAFTWTFSDADAGDTQSQYVGRYRIVGAGSWTAFGAVIATSSHTFAASHFAAGSYEWQMATYDVAGALGPYSASSFFSAAGVPATPTITAPLVDDVMGSSVLLQWLAAAQETYQVRTVANSFGSPDTGTVHVDSGLSPMPLPGRGR